MIGFKPKRHRPVLISMASLKIYSPRIFAFPIFSRKSNQRNTFSTLMLSHKRLEESVNFFLYLDCQLQYSPWYYFIFFKSQSPSNRKIFIHAHDVCDFLDRVLCFGTWIAMQLSFLFTLAFQGDNPTNFDFLDIVCGLL